jgi:aminoglycoside 3-N-acetyltransferase
MQTEASVIARTEAPVTQRSLVSDLRALGLEAGAIVHASLSAFGWVVGGAQATRAMGAIADCFLRHARTVRSPHPIVSFAANGPLAEAITAEHPLSPALGETSPLARLYERDARIVLLGVGHERNTSLHLAEYRAVWPSKRHYTEGTAVVVNGERRWIRYNELDLNDADFPAIGRAFSARGSARTGAVGQAAAILCEQRALIDFAAEWISANRT